MLVRDGEENADDFWIELGTSAAANFLFGVGHGECVAVRAVADHGVECIGDREYAGAERDLLAAKTARIAGAVEKFLVGQNNLGSIAEKRDAPKDVVADFAVCAHDL